MIKKIINQLLDDNQINLNFGEKPQRIDIVLGGGAFNGSYLIGALFFLKEMEKRNYIIVERISGCSIGSIA